tara:strand:- start:64 stop:537 length:474 start_codon:yes stop_codon:yes gene_type:complete
MKKILILLIGFAFTQSIQTKQVEVNLNSMADLEYIDGYYGINISSYLNLIGEDYLLMLIESQSDFEALGCDYQMTGFWASGGGYGGEALRMSPDCPYLLIPNQIVLQYITFPYEFKFWVTGMFEDAGVGLQGDMNDDEIINVVDIVALVNIIIGEEE